MQEGRNVCPKRLAELTQSFFETNEGFITAKWGLPPSPAVRLFDDAAKLSRSPSLQVRGFFYGETEVCRLPEAGAVAEGFASCVRKGLDRPGICLPGIHVQGKISEVVKTVTSRSSFGPNFLLTTCSS